MWNNMTSFKIKEPKTLKGSEQKIKESETFNHPIQ